jgi:hypothetical protein
MVSAEDRGDMVVGWLTRVIVVIAVVAIIGFDAIIVVQSQITVRDQASSAATAGLTSYSHDHNVETAYHAALADAQSANPADTIKPSDFRISTTGVVTVVVSRPVHTLLAHYLPMTSAKTATATGTAAPSP